MVAGGWTGSARLDTTEVYQDNEWRTVSGKLPRPMYLMVVKKINDKIFLFGIYHFMSASGLFFIFNYRWMG